ncbi:MAG: lipopolysaccharide biosynthesis protein [Clostridia bacterium]|nr:MAG: lipopolysaccharide biosynthesis protein [Clostridia bacterium]
MALNDLPQQGMSLVPTMELRDYLEIIRKWRTMIILFAVIAVVTSGIFSFFVIPPVYETKAVLMVTRPAQNNQSRPANQQGLESVVGTVSSLPEMTVNTYVGQITAPVVLKRVIKKLQLDPVLYTPESLAGMIAVEAVKDTNLIEIKVQHNDPKLAANIANTLADEFLAFISENSEAQMAKSVEFLQQQRQNVEQELTTATESLKQFNAKPRGVELLQKEVEKRTADLTQYQSQLTLAGVELQQLQAARAQLEARLAQTPPTITVKQMLPPEAIAALQARQSGPATGAEGQEVPLPAIPVEQLTVPVEEVNAAYVSLQQSLAEKEAAVADKEAEITGLTQIIAEVQKGLEELQAELTTKATEQARLQRQVTQLEEAEALLAEKVTETRVAQSVNLGEVSLLLAAPAQVPNAPVKPNKKLNLAVAGAVGLVVAVGLALLLEYLDNTVKEPEDLERRLGLPLLGTIPEVGSRLK